MAKINLNPQNAKYRNRYNKHNNSNENAVSNIARYITNKDKTPSHYINLYGVPDSSPDGIQTSFEAIAKIHNKDMEGRRKAEHFIISFNAHELEEIGGISSAVTIVDEYCQNIATEYQAVSAFHENTKNLHAHIMINPINYHTGKRLQKNRSFLDSQIRLVDSLVDKYKKQNSGNN